MNRPVALEKVLDEASKDLNKAVKKYRIPRRSLEWAINLTINEVGNIVNLILACEKKIRDDKISKLEDLIKKNKIDPQMLLDLHGVTEITFENGSELNLEDLDIQKHLEKMIDIEE